jgi:molybdate/tungstate transport system ATP-binding protein
MIRVADLTVRVPGFVLDRVSFTVPTGHVAVLTGPTGAGKTTLLETIAGVRDSASGSVTLGATDVTQLPPERRAIGLVYQQAWLFPHLSVRGNVAYGARDGRSVEPLVDLLQLQSLMDKPVSTLSGGERQLVALARALACQPKILLLDEPFAAMDSALRASVRAAVLGWVADRGLTTLLVTHDANEAALPGSVQLRIEKGALLSVG